MRWFLGFLLILIGALVLGSNFGWWNNLNFEQLYVLWPILLILLGIAIVFRKWRFGWAIVLLAFLIFIAFLISVPSSRYVRNTNNREVQRTEISENLPATAKSGEVNIDTGAVELDVSEGSSKFVEGTFESNIISPSIKIEQENDKIKATIETVQRANFHLGRQFKNSLDLKLSELLPIDLKINSGASDIDLRLDKIILKSLNLNAGASSLKIKLGDKIENGANVVVKAGASSIEISAPESIGIDMTVKAGASSKDFEGMDKIDNDHYKSQGFDSASKKISISLEAGVSSLKLERK